MEVLWFFVTIWIAFFVLMALFEISSALKEIRNLLQRLADPKSHE